MKPRIFGLLIAAGLLSAAGNPAAAAPCTGVTFGASFTSAYTCNDLGTPASIPANLGGIAFLDNDTLLLGGAANQAGGAIYRIGVVRDADNHITGFSGGGSVFASAPFVDGGIAFGPNNVLFATGYPNNTLLQYKPGSTVPDKVINLSALAGTDVGSSVGALNFVPAGFDGAGQLKLVSYNTGQFYTATLAPDADGTFDVTVELEVTLPGGPEGLVYVSGANDGFDADSILISEYGFGSVGAYEIDANGDPILGTREVFLSGLTGAEGAVIDPLTGDFLFSTFGGGNRVLVISGFEAPEPPPSAIPEPATLILLGGAMIGIGILRRRRS